MSCSISSCGIRAIKLYTSQTAPAIEHFQRLNISPLHQRNFESLVIFLAILPKVSNSTRYVLYNSRPGILLLLYKMVKVSLKLTSNSQTAHAQMATLSDIYGEALEGVQSWLINPIKSTVNFILDNALKLAAGILALPIFLLMYPYRTIAASGLFRHPPQRPNPFAEWMDTEFGPRQGHRPQRPNPFAERMGPEFEPRQGHPASRGGTDIGKSSLVNTFPELRDNTTSASGSLAGEDYTYYPTKQIYTEFESKQQAIDVSRAEYEKMKQELYFEYDKIHIAVIGGTGVGKSSLVNGLRGLRDREPGAAPVGETDCTKSINRYEDSRFPWIVWCDVPGAGTQDRSTPRYFEEHGLFLMDFVLVVCASRVRDLDIAILKRALHYGIPAALVRSKADLDLRQRAKRECDDEDDEEEIKSKMRTVKNGYVKEIKEDLMKEVEKAGLQGYITPRNCFLVSAKILRELMRKSQDLPALRGLDESSYANNSAEIAAAVNNHVQRVFSKAEEVDEAKLLEMVFTSVAKSRYDS